MRQIGTRQAGFGAVELLVVALVVVVLAAGGWVVYQHHHSSGNPKADTTTSQTTTQQQNSTTTHPPADPYAGWQTFTDNASAGTSGISVKYPPDWQAHVGGSKIHAWSISGAHGGITARYVFLTNSWTAQEEWENCAVQISADACGAAPGDKTVSGSTSTINGLNAYTATMQSSSNGTYHVTVIRGNKATAAGVPYVELTTFATDQTDLDMYATIVASATFPN